MTVKIWMLAGERWRKRSETVPVVDEQRGRRRDDRRVSERTQPATAFVEDEIVVPVRLEALAIAPNHSATRDDELAGGGS